MVGASAVGPMHSLPPSQQAGVLACPQLTWPPNAKHMLSAAMSPSIARVSDGGSSDVAPWLPGIDRSLIRVVQVAPIMQPVASNDSQAASCTLWICAS